MVASLAATSDASAATSAATYRTVAADRFGPAPCGSVIVRRETLRASHVFADANPATCTIRVNPAAWNELDAPQRCRVVLHEYGHLVLGPQHAASGLMAAGWNGRSTPARCSRASLRAANAALTPVAASGDDGSQALISNRKPALKA